jgi:hypothetical protein
MSWAYVTDISYFEKLPKAAGRESAGEVWRAVLLKCRDNPFFTNEFIHGKFQTDQAYVAAGWLLGKAERREVAVHSALPWVGVPRNFPFFIPSSVAASSQTELHFFTDYGAEDARLDASTTANED